MSLPPKCGQILPSDKADMRFISAFIMLIAGPNPVELGK